ncbi:MFS transporter [Helicobacter cholecystus]|uniref:MFS transporter n=1 Tax=Helicobacter cholecystus TaxID=45498 RepID=A0A3D8IUG1_9HELI|nr:MFS transporter [Helicobacter cholecystus]RDU68929.1 MFS transporter [Helicobacter cholecystus]VEJ25920.1 major facilitator superfamily protein [Helicobacter cholecystus]
MPSSRFEQKMIEITDRKSLKLALFSASTMTVLGALLVSPALPAITKAFSHTPHIQILSGLMLTIPALFVMIFSPIAGFLMDKYTKLRFLYPAMIVWVLAGMSGALCENIYTLIATRCVLGIATAFVSVGVNALLGDYYSFGAGRRERALSIQGSIMSIVGAVLTALSGYLTNYAWQYAFLVYGSGIIVIVLCFIFLFEPHTRSPKQINITNSLQNQSKSSYQALLPVYFIGFFMMVAYYLVGIEFPHYIEDVLDLEPKYIGLAMALPTLGFGIFSFFYKDIAKFLSIKRIYIVALCIEFIAFFLVFLVQNFTLTSFSLFCFGAVGGLIVANNSNYLFKLSSPSNRAKLYAILASCTFFGQFITPFIATPISLSIGLQNTCLLWAGVIFIVALGFCSLRFKE